MSDIQKGIVVGLRDYAKTLPGLGKAKPRRPKATWTQYPSLRWAGGKSHGASQKDGLIIHYCLQGDTMKIRLNANIHAYWGFDMTRPSNVAEMEQLIQAVHTLAQWMTEVKK